MIQKPNLMAITVVLLSIVFAFIANSNFLLLFTADNVFDETISKEQPLISKTSPNGKYQASFYINKGNSLSSDVLIGDIVYQGKARTFFKATKVYDIQKINVQWENDTTLIIDGGFQLNITKKNYEFNNCDVEVIDDDTIVVNRIELDVRYDEFDFLRFLDNIITTRRILAICSLLFVSLALQSNLHLYSHSFMQHTNNVHECSSSLLRTYFFANCKAPQYKKINTLFRFVSIAIHTVFLFELLVFAFTCVNWEYYILFEKISCIFFLSLLSLYVCAFIAVNIYKKTREEKIGSDSAT